MTRIILTLLLFLGAIAGAVFYVWPEVERYNAMRRDTQALLRIRTELEDAERVRDELAAKIRSVSETDLSRAEEALPKGSEAETLIRTIEYYGVQNSVLVSMISLESTSSSEDDSLLDPSVPRPGGGLQVISESQKRDLEIRLDIAGSYANVKRFIDALERHIRIIDVETVDFSAPESAASAVRASISARAYYQ